MTLNISEVLNELSYSQQVINLQEKEMLTSFTCQCFWISQGDNREIISTDMNFFIGRYMLMLRMFSERPTNEPNASLTGLKVNT